MILFKSHVPSSEYKIVYFLLNSKVELHDGREDIDSFVKLLISSVVIKHFVASACSFKIVFSSNEFSRSSYLSEANFLLNFAFFSKFIKFSGNVPLTKDREISNFLSSDGASGILVSNSIFSATSLDSI